MITKDIDEEIKLNNDDDLKNPASTLKGSKGKLRFTKFTVSIWFSLCI